MKINETALYRFALENPNIFPAGIYTLEKIYDIIEKFVYIPEHHKVDRPDVPYPKWKNYIHTVRPSIERIEFLGNETYRFN